MRKEKMTKILDVSIWNKFIKYGSGFTLEAERDYKKRGEPLVYHLFLYGLWTDDENEFVGEDLNVLMKEAIKMFGDNMRKANNK
jgi:hypothetical protein